MPIPRHTQGACPDTAPHPCAAARRRLLIGLCWLTAGAPSSAQTSGAPATTASSPGRKNRSSPRLPTPPDSSESRQEREQRLRRECRGRPNAGACEGHAS